MLGALHGVAAVAIGASRLPSSESGNPIALATDVALANPRAGVPWGEAEEVL